MSAPTLADQHALYRFHDRADELLYVGLTNNPARRFTQHAGDKPWWTEVATIRMETFPTRDAALTAERAAIVSERPRYNIVHNKSGLDPVVDPTIWGSPAGASPAETAGEWPVAVDDVVALGLADDDCYVGRVDAVSAAGVKLAQLDWLSGFFGREIFTTWGRIQEIKFAYPMSVTKARAQGYGDRGDVYECDPLGDFQTYWQAGRGERGREAARKSRQTQDGFSESFRQRRVRTYGDDRRSPC